MNNINRCDWCIKEYPVEKIVIHHINGKVSKFCSEDCWDEHLMDIIADMKDNRTFAELYGK